MRVFKLGSDARSADWALKNEIDSPIYDRFDGSVMKSDWVPRELVPADENGVRGDIGMLGTIPVFSSHTVAVLREILQTHGELLPVICAGEPYFAFNCTVVLNALDESSAELRRFTTGEVMWITRFAFWPQVIGRAQVFRISQLPRSHVLVTDPFVARVRDAGLKGFHLREVWTDLLLQ